MSDEEWGNLGNFDANDSYAGVKASNKIRTSDPEYQKKYYEGQKKIDRSKQAKAIKDYQKERGGFFTGGKHTEEWKLQQSKRKKGKKTGKDNNSAMPVETPIGIFDTVKQAAEALGITGTGLQYRLRNNWPGYKRLKNKSAE